MALMCAESATAVYPPLVIDPTTGLPSVRRSEAGPGVKATIRLLEKAGGSK
jgi:hypothetical protein